MNALLITDDIQDEAILSQVLRLAGMTVSAAHQLASPMEQWPERPADFLVVALRHPDPLRIVREIRGIAIVPLVLIVDSVTEDDHLALLEAGADWVTERPYNARLLIGYTKVLARRATGVIRQSLPTLQYEVVRLDPASRTVRIGEKRPQRLSQLEFRLLHTLMVHRGQILPTETIVEHVWGYSGEGDRSLVRGLVNRLRMKIESNPNNPQYIRTVPRVGYTFGDEEAA
jgi:DNA-binding response OmpR family regulator